MTRPPALASEALLREIAREVGTPAYVYCAETIKARYRDFAEAFRPAGPLIAYAVKANSNLSVIRILAELGAGADIVSLGELLRARAAGVPAERIVFSGVGKTREELDRALAEGLFQVNLESVEEASELSELAVERGVTADVSIRVTPDIPQGGGHSKISTGCASTKFGIPIGEALGAFELVRAMPALKLRGLSIHIGSQMLDLAPLRAALGKLDALVGDIRRRGHKLATVSVGGGLGVAYRETDRPPSAEEYAALVLSHARRWESRLILEPGRWLVAGAGCLLSRVIRIKRNRDRQFLILDAGMNDLARPSLYDAWHRIDVVGRDDRREERYDLVGPVCETSDIFGTDRRIAAAASGDLVAIGDAGAYGSSMAGNYNSRPLAAEVLVEKEGWRLVRRRQTHARLLADELGLDRPGSR